MPSACLNMREAGFRPDSPGGWGEYLIMKHHYIHKLPDDWTYEEGALVEPFSVGYFGLWGNNGYVDASDNVVIFGAGPIGLSALIVAKASRAKVIQVELLENRIAAIQELIEKRKNPLPLLYALDIRKTDKMFFSYLYVGGEKDKKTSSQESSFLFLKDESTKNSYVLKLKVKIWGDYESAYKVIKEIAADLRGINILRNIKVIPPKLDKITPQVTEDSVQLTNVGWQEFILDADLKM